jgi:hypothetical protein
MINSQFLQFIPQKEIERLIIDNNARILRKYLNERELIPEGRLAEVAFKDLDEAPLETLSEMYAALGLNGFESARHHIEEYLRTVENYRKNRYRPPAKRIIQKINREWDFWFDAFGYALKNP